MGGFTFEEDCQIMLPRTLVLVGKTGNGKSATGNSILGMQMFQSKRSFSGVTKTSELKTNTMEDGQPLNVIDTPGLFDSSLDVEFIGKEIVSCIRKARDGIDAFLVVISICSRFAEDEQSAISTLRTLFGREVYSYMIIIFTGGDGIKYDNHESVEEILRESPKALQETLGLCGNRYVLFDNKTDDPDKKSIQVGKLLSLVNTVSKNNGGKPYTNEIFTEMKKLTCGKGDEMPGYDEQFKRIYEMVESKLKETTLKFEQLLAEERAARLKTEEDAKAAQKKSAEEIHMLREELKEAKKREDAKAAQKNMAEVIQKLREEMMEAKKREEAIAAEKKSAEEIQKLREELKEARKREEEQKESRKREKEQPKKTEGEGCNIL